METKDVVEAEEPDHIDPFYPVLKTEVTPHELTAEQDDLVQKILSTACSDSKFAKKAYDAIKLLLAGGVQLESTGDSGKPKKKK